MEVTSMLKVASRNTASRRETPTFEIGDASWMMDEKQVWFCYANSRTLPVDSWLVLRCLHRDLHDGSSQGSVWEEEPSVNLCERIRSKRLSEPDQKKIMNSATLPTGGRMTRSPPAGSRPFDSINLRRLNGRSGGWG